MSDVDIDRRLGMRRHHSVLPWVWLVLAVVLGFFLFTEHWAHFFGVLPFLLVLLCPLMHLFMHHGHGGHTHGPVPSARPNSEARP